MPHECYAEPELCIRSISTERTKPYSACNPVSRVCIVDRVGKCPFCDLDQRVLTESPAVMGSCFYCNASLRNRRLAVDHFVPWSLYPNDLGHNFVLADETCNAKKSDALAAVGHLETWCQRLDDHGPTLGVEFDSVGIIHDESASRRVTSWTYSNAEQSSARLWIKADDFEPIDATWRSVVRL